MAKIDAMEFVTTTRTARLYRTANGIVVTRINAHVKQSITDAVENVAASAAAHGGRQGPLLVDARQAEVLDAEARHYFTGRNVTDNFSALAMLVQAGPFGTMFGNLYFRVARLEIPYGLFRVEEEALRWLARQTR
jgi:hypothetical protein